MEMWFGDIYDEELKNLMRRLKISLLINTALFVCGSLSVKAGYTALSLILFLACALNHIYFIWRLLCLIDYLSSLREDDEDNERTGDEEFPEFVQDTPLFQYEHNDTKQETRLKKDEHVDDDNEESVEDTSEPQKVENGALLFKKGILEEFDVYGYCRELIDEARKRVNITLRMDDESLVLYSDKSAFRLIFENILDNEYKYMRVEDTLEITISKNEEKMLIIFRDNGEGVSESTPDRLMLLNYQGKNKRSGTGLGLAQVDAIVKSWNGKTWIKSSKGSGFAIYIELPYNQYFKEG